MLECIDYIKTDDISRERERENKQCSKLKTRRHIHWHADQRRDHIFFPYIVAKFHNNMGLLVLVLVRLVLVSCHQFCFSMLLYIEEVKKKKKFQNSNANVKQFDASTATTHTEHRTTTLQQIYPPTHQQERLEIGLSVYLSFCGVQGLEAGRYKV